MKTNIKPKITHSIIIDLLWTVLLSLGVASFVCGMKMNIKVKAAAVSLLGLFYLELLNLH